MLRKIGLEGKLLPLFILELGLVLMLVHFDKSILLANNELLLLNAFILE